MHTERELYVVAACLDCEWKRVGTSLHRDAHRVVQHVPKHVERHGHTVVVSRNELRTYRPDDD